MHDRLIYLGIVLVGLLAVMPLVAVQAPSGTAPAADENWTVPRTPDGNPDLQGVYNSGTYTPLERPVQLGDKAFYTEEEAIELFKKAAEADYTRDPGVHYDFTEYGLDKWQQNGVRPYLRTSLIYDPPNGRLPPRTPEAEKRVAAAPRRGAGYRTRGWYERCVKGYWGIPMLKGTGSSDIGADLGTGSDGEVQILQTRDHVVIVAQANHDVRVIPLTGRPHLSPTVTRWYGDPRGRWEGDTLVIETANFNEHTQFLGSTKGMRLTERLSLGNANTLLYRFTVEDPATWTRPWSAEVEWPRAEPPIFEFACHETNYGFLAVLKGAQTTQRAGRRVLGFGGGD